MKRHGDFVHAAALLRATHPATRFIVLGSAYEYRHAYLKRLLRLAGELGLRPGIDLILRDPGGRVSELASALDVFWLTSDRRSEGVPTAVGEAMALGLPVVATNVGGVPEAVEHGRTGFIVPARRPDELAAATRQLVDDPDLRANFGAAGRRRASSLFTLERCVEAHDHAFRLAATRARLGRAVAFDGRRSSYRPLTASERLSVVLPAEAFSTG